MSRRDHKGLRVEVEITGDRMDQGLRHLVKLFNIGQDEGVLTDKVDDAWDAAAGTVYGCCGLIGENLLRRAGDQQSLGDVVGGLFGGD